MALLIWVEWEVTNNIALQNNKSPLHFGGDFFVPAKKQCGISLHRPRVQNTYEELLSIRFRN